MNHIQRSTKTADWQLGWFEQKRFRKSEEETTYQPHFGGCAHFPMGFKDPSVVGEQSFEGVSQQVDEEQPQASGEQDCTQHCSGLHRQVVSARKRHNGEKCRVTFIYLAATAYSNPAVQQNTRKLNYSNGCLSSSGLWMITDLYGRFSLMASIIPRERSTWMYKELIIAITIISQLDGLAG